MAWTSSIHILLAVVKRIDCCYVGSFSSTWLILVTYDHAAKCKLQSTQRKRIQKAHLIEGKEGLAEETVMVEMRMRTRWNKGMMRGSPRELNHLKQLDHRGAR